MLSAIHFWQYFVASMLFNLFQPLKASILVVLLLIGFREFSFTRAQRVGQCTTAELNGFGEAQYAGSDISWEVTVTKQSGDELIIVAPDGSSSSDTSKTITMNMSHSFHLTSSSSDFEVAMGPYSPVIETGLSTDINTVAFTVRTKNSRRVAVSNLMLNSDGPVSLTPQNMSLTLLT